MTTATSVDAPPETAILFVVVSLFFGIISRQMLHNIKVPYTVVLLLIGLGLGALEYGTRRGLGVLGHSIRMWSNINPGLILYVFLPALLFESSFSMEVHQIKRCMVQMLLLAGPGVVISTICLGLVHRYIFPYGWSWSLCLLLGGLLSATDPVAVVALLKEVGASKKLGTIIEGESLMNDGTAMVVYELFRRMVLGKHYTFGEIVEFLCQVALGAVAMGVVFGIVSVFWLGAMFNDTIMEITLTFTASYCAFFIAQEVAEVSGVLAVMSIGIFLGAFAKTAFRGESQESMHHFWTIIAYFANTLIFILSGVVISESFLESQNLIERRDWGYLIVLYLFLQLSRAVVVLVLYPGLAYHGYGLCMKEAIVLIWAGLRGAVALALSLSVHDTGNTNKFTDEVQAKFVFFTGGVVFLTLIINGSSTEFLLKFLHIETTSETKRLVIEHVKYEMNRRATEAYDELGEDEELGPAEWATVCKYISCLQRFHREERPVHPHELGIDMPESTGNASRKIQLEDTRLRFLNGVQAAYWEMLEEGRITETAALLLMQSVDEALDRVVDHERVTDWMGLRPHVHFPSYLRHLQACTTWLPQKLLTYLIVERLELGCYISAAFLRAHLIVRRHLRDFIGETEVSLTIIKESEEEGVEARQYLEDIRLTFAQILRVVKTKQVVHTILLRLLDYIHSLEKSGLLEAREMTPLHNAVQGEMKKLLRNPPSIKMPKGSDISSRHPLIAMLPPNDQITILSGAKEFLKFRGNYLYKEGWRPDGVWLIASGVVKWSSGVATDQHLLHPTFSHGSTLGLYEVLVGRPYLCDVVADSVVQCFFIDASKFVPVIQSDPEVEHLFWQESTLAVAKILIPQLFEAVTMLELRVLVQNSSLISFLRREVVEIGPNEVGILLEGFVKKEGKGDLIGAPAGLLFEGTIHTSQETSTRPSVHLGSVFHIETRCRLIVLVSPPSIVSPRSGGGLDSFVARSCRRNSDQRRNSDEECRTSYDQKLMRAITTKALAPQWQTGSPGQTLQGTFSFFRPRKSLPSQEAAAVTSTVTKNMSLPSIPMPAPIPSLRIKTQRKTQEDDRGGSAMAERPDSSEEDEEHIIQVDSPSSLFNEQEGDNNSNKNNTTNNINKHDTTELYSP